MKRSPVSWDMTPLPPHHEGVRSKQPNHRIALLSYDDIIARLMDNEQHAFNSKKRVARVNIFGYAVHVNTMKLRTFAHHHQHHGARCAHPACQIRPAYFALEVMHYKPFGNQVQSAFLALYGLDEQGREVEFTHDHTVARCFGGANTLANTTMMCQPCNNNKSRLESKLHNKTLLIVKQHLEQHGMDATEPKMLLERVRDGNKALEPIALERVGVVDLDEVRQAWQQQLPCASWWGKSVLLSGQRMATLVNQPCCQDPDCGLPASHFAVECLAHRQDGKRSHFLNLYARSSTGQDVGFVHDHVTDDEGRVSTVTLCRPCYERRHVSFSDLLAEADEAMLLDRVSGILGDTNPARDWRQALADFDGLLEEVAASRATDKDGLLAWCRLHRQPVPGDMGRCKPKVAAIMAHCGLDEASARAVERLCKQEPWYDRWVTFVQAAGAALDQGLLEATVKAPPVPTTGPSKRVLRLQQEAAWIRRKLGMQRNAFAAWCHDYGQSLEQTMSLTITKTKLAQRVLGLDEHAARGFVALRAAMKGREQVREPGQTMSWAQWQEEGMTRPLSATKERLAKIACAVDALGVPLSGYAALQDGWRYERLARTLMNATGQSVHDSIALADLLTQRWTNDRAWRRQVLAQWRAAKTHFQQWSTQEMGPLQTTAAATAFTM